MLEDKLKGLKLGSDYLTKPFEMEELIARINNILESKSGTDQERAESQKIFKIASYAFDYVNQYLNTKANVRNSLKKKLTFCACWQ